MAYTLAGSVFITTSFVGFHHWPDAPADVAYLADDHRHLFKVRIDVSVEHKNRAIEYHQLKRQVDDFIHSQYFGEPVPLVRWERDLDDRSCEVIAGVLLDFVKAVAYPDRPYYRVEVSEDGENGSVVEARKEDTNG